MGWALQGPREAAQAAAVMEQGEPETARSDQVPGVTQKPSLTQTLIRGHCQLLSAGFAP